LQYFAKWHWVAIAEGHTDGSFDHHPIRQATDFRTGAVLLWYGSWFRRGSTDSAGHRRKQRAISHVERLTVAGGEADAIWWGGFQRRDVPNRGARANAEPEAVDDFMGQNILLLADCVDPSNPLFHEHWVPGQAVVKGVVAWRLLETIAAWKDRSD
jgi:hypothetical protein